MQVGMESSASEHLPATLAYMGIGGRLRTARTAKGLTQADVARHFDVAPQTVSAWERGDSEVIASKLAELATLYGVSTDALLGIGDGKSAAAGPGLRTVPLVTADEAREWAVGGYAAVRGDHPPVQIESEVPWGRAVAVRVTNNAMAPAFPPGCVVVVSRAHQPAGGDAVLVDLGRGAPLLRYLIAEGPTPMLAAENPQFPLVELKSGRIIGRVIEVIIRRVVP